MSKTLRNLASGVATGLLAGAAMAWWLARYEPLGMPEYEGLWDSATGEEDLRLHLDPARLRTATEALSVIAMRRGGTPGEVMARNWVRDRFKAVGLRDVHLRPVLYPRWQRRKRSELTLFTPAPFDPDFIVLAGSAATPSEGMERPLVDAGHGSEAEYLVRTSRGLQGAVHLIHQREGGEPRRDLVLRATRYGAAGVILANATPSPQGKPLLENGTAVMLTGRIPALAVSHETGRYLRRQMEKGRVRALLHINVGYTAGLAYNVVGSIPGQTREYVVLAAHYDAWYAGAADNAGGVASLLELARVWTERGLRPRRTIRFVSYAAEEEGLMGSLFDVITRAALVKARCRGVVTPDLVGVPGTDLRLGGYPAGLVEAAADLAEQWGYRAATGNGVATSGAPAYGDHWPYAQLLLPALVVSKGHDPFYHTPYDTADRLDYEDMRWTAALSGALALRLAQR